MIKFGATFSHPPANFDQIRPMFAKHGPDSANGPNIALIVAQFGRICPKFIGGLVYFAPARMRAVIFE